MRHAAVCRPTFVLGLLLVGTAVPASSQVQATIAVNDQRLQGTHAGGSLLLYSPDPLILNSSLAHWDPAAMPNLLMEPSLTSALPFLGLDITPAQMQDMFWNLGTSNINVFPIDAPGTGFADPRAFPGAPGNPATTLGEARLNLFNAVLGAWANTLGSAVDIDVLVTWQPLACSPELGTNLAAASTTSIILLEGMGLAPHFFHAALAESLIGQDLTGPPTLGGGDLLVIMNREVDNECLGPGTSFYYGIDGNPPPGQLDLAATVLHELGHGLGFSSFINLTTGEQFGDAPSIFDFWTFDNILGKFWDQMSDSERAGSVINVRQVTWEGPAANTAAAGALATGVPELVVTAPAEVAGTYEVSGAAFGPAVVAGGLAGEIACFEDDVADITVLNGCTAATNAGELAGKIALIDRGTCAFTTKVANAQAAGAIAAIIVNNAGNGLFTLAGEDPAITIPAVMVGRRDGNRIRRATCSKAAAFFFGDRFQVTARWRTHDAAGEAGGVELTDLSGYFFFFGEANIEVTVKMLDACNLPGFNSFWLFAAGMTDVEVNLTVVDTQTGVSKSYFNPLGSAFAPILDTSAFSTCP